MKKMTMILLTILFVVSVSGCTKANGHDTLNAKDKTLAWQGKKEKPFGKFEYRKLNEKEAKKLLKEKFSVDLPPYYNDIQIVFNKHFITDTVQSEPAEYSLTSNGESLYLRAINKYYQQDELVLFTYTDLEYQFDSKEKQATLKNQTLTISNSSENGQLPKNDFDKTFKDIGNLLNIDLTKNVKDLHTLLKKDQGKLGGSVLQVYENRNAAVAANELQKSVAVELDSKENIRQLYFYIIDEIDKNKE